MGWMRENNKRMKTDLDTMMELYWYVLLAIQPCATSPYTK